MQQKVGVKVGAPLAGPAFLGRLGWLATGRHSGKTDSWRVREQPSAAVFVFAVDVVFHLCPNDFPKLEMWLFTPKAAISHPHPPPHTHTHTHTHTHKHTQRGNLPSPQQCLTSHLFPALPTPRHWGVLDLASLLSTGTTPTPAIPTVWCYGVGVCKRCGCV